MLIAVHKQIATRKLKFILKKLEKRKKNGIYILHQAYPNIVNADVVVVVDI